MKDHGIDLLRAYHESIAPAVQPVEVEQGFLLDTGVTQHPMKGYIDLIDDQRLFDADILPDNVESLLSLCKVLGIQRPNNHSGLEDARITAEIYVHLTNRLGKESLAVFK